MKKIILTAAMSVLAAFTQAASIVPVPVNGQTLNCVLNAGCTNSGVDTNVSFMLPGTLGTGFLLTRVTAGDSNSPAAGLYSYQYSIDLSGVSPNPSNAPCVTNVVACTTNRVAITLTNVTVCCTNHISATDVRNCFTYVLPGTNIVTTLTNSFPATNIVVCHTFPTGVTLCFTNTFDATNIVVTVTNHISDRFIYVCQTNHIPTTNVVTCVTTNINTYTNIVTCISNNIVCPQSTPCISDLIIPFGRTATNLDIDTNGTAGDRVFVVTNGLASNSVPTQITLEDGTLTLHFSPPLCPGSSSAAIGLVSSHAPRDVTAKIEFGAHGKLKVASRGPIIPIECSFSNLVSLIQNLHITDILPPNNANWTTRRDALLSLALAAQDAAALGNSDDVATALATLIDHTGGNNSWVTRSVARQISQAVSAISDCVGGDEDNHHGDNDDNDQGDNDGSRHHGN